MKILSALILTAAAATAVIAMPACSESADAPDPISSTDGNVIRFAANTESARAGDITTNNLTAFKVYAYTGYGSSPELFMDNVEVTKTNLNTWEYSPLKYWPSDKTVDFYAYAPVSWLGSANPLSGIPYETYLGTEDIVYAVSPGLKGVSGAANAQVLFNFRHALSKLTVKMSSTNEHLTVRVSNVAISYICSKGNFHFPTGSTASAPDEENVGTWSDQNSPTAYVLHMSQRPDDIITLSSTATDMGTTTLPGQRYLIPQPLTWRNNGSKADNYIAVMCSVYDTASGTKVWPNENTPEENIVAGSTFGDGLLKFPLMTSAFSEWKPGYSYIYNLVINSNDDMGAIEFGNPTVDNFVTVETTYQ